jgi:DNA-binding MarR family transcriptional regulator
LDDIRERELTEQAIELLPQLTRLLKSTLCMPGDAASIPFGQMRVMSHLYHNGRSTVGEVASGVGVSLATASELIDRLVERGSVERGVNPSDRRQVYLWLTPPAVEIGDLIHDRQRAQMAAAFTRLSEDERAGFVHGLRALVESLEETVAASPKTVVD